MSVPTTIAKPTVTKPIRQRHAGAVDDPAELVAHVGVDAQQVLGLLRRAAQEVDAGCRQALDAVLVAEQDLVGRIARELVGEQGDEHEEPEQDQAHDCVALAEHAAAACRATGWPVARGWARPATPAGAMAVMCGPSSEADPRVEAARSSGRPAG